MTMNTTVQGWLQQAKKNAGWLIALGVVEIVAGVLAIFSPLMAGLAVTLMVGFALVVGGGARIVGAFKADSFGAGTLTLLWGLLILVAGFYFITRPGLGLESLTLTVTLLLFAEGVMRIMLSFKIRPSRGWGWMLAGGILSVVCAVIIWQGYPGTSVWVVGTLVGFSLISNGFTMVAVASGARKVAAVAQAA
jgi:uncharacterized membrane protein HdeD (DUF308 family)